MGFVERLQTSGRAGAQGLVRVGLKEAQHEKSPPGGTAAGFGVRLGQVGNWGLSPIFPYSPYYLALERMERRSPVV